MNIQISKIGVVKSELSVSFTGIRITNHESHNGGALVELLAEDGAVIGTLKSGHEMHTGDTLMLNNLKGNVPVGLK